MKRFEKHGYYAFRRHTHVVATSSAADLDAVDFHESMHATVAAHSNLGLVCMMLRSSIDRGQGDANHMSRALAYLVEQTEEPHEGLATYAEYIRACSADTSNTFLAEIQARPIQYATSFESAIKIDSILSDERLVGVCTTAHEKRLLRLYTLIDVARFSLNVPIYSLIKDVEDAKLLSILMEILATARPNLRWRTVLDGLLSQPTLAERFVQLAMETFKVWLAKRNAPLREDGKYGGILLGDNVEGILATLFPALSWRPPSEDFAEVVSTIADKEAHLDFLLREGRTELVFRPKRPIGWLAGDGKRRIMEALSFEEDVGCYLRVFPATPSRRRVLDWGDDIPAPVVPRGEAVVIVDRAKLIPTAGGKVSWNYQFELKAAFLSRPDVLSTMESIQTDLSVVVADIDIREPKPLWFVSEAAACGVPLFAHVASSGSLATFAQLLQDPFLRDVGADVYALPAFTHFSGVDWRQLVMIFIVPRLPARKVAIFFPVITGFMVALEQFFELVGADFAHVNVPQVREVTPLMRWSRGSAGASEIDTIGSLKAADPALWTTVRDDPGHLLCPARIDVCVAHIVSFGC